MWGPNEKSKVKMSLCNSANTCHLYIGEDVLVPLLPPSAPCVGIKRRQCDNDNSTSRQRSQDRVSYHLSSLIERSFARIRTEPTEIYYLWQDISSGGSGKVTKAEHLTTYASPGSTYKSISVPLPTSAKPGQSWRLGLFPTDHGPEHQLLAKVLDEGSEVLGVWSGPIEILGAAEERSVKRAKLDGKDVSKQNGKGKGKEKEKDEGPKQTRIQREWTLGTEAEDEAQDMLRIIEQTSFDLDKVSSYAWNVE